MKKRAVLDSSTLVSAFLTAGGTPATLLRLARQGAFSLHLSDDILLETTQVLLRPRLIERYRYTAEDVEAYQAALATIATIEADLPELTGVVPGDPKDDVIIATAVRAEADYLVTGDRRHLLPLGMYAGVKIVTPRDFLDQTKG